MYEKDYVSNSGAIFSHLQGGDGGILLRNYAVQPLVLFGARSPHRRLARGLAPQAHPKKKHAQVAGRSSKKTRAFAVLKRQDKEVGGGNVVKPLSYLDAWEGEVLTDAVQALDARARTC